jgi:thioredoxin-related protein
MPTLRILCLSPVSLILLAAIPACDARTGSEKEHKSKPDRPAIFDTKADGEKQIADALKIASRDNKRLLLMFGANWCPWCHKLHELFRTDDAVRRYLDDHFLLVMVDIGEKKGEPLNQDVVGKYSIPVKEYGYPCLAVLDSRGKVLCTQSTGVLEKNKAHDPQKVLAFLKLQIAQK